MKILAGLLLLGAGLSAQTNLCGLAADTSFGEVQVYCVPNLSQYIPWATDKSMAQIWIKPTTTIAQAYYLILGYRFAGREYTEHRMIWGSGLFATSFWLPTLEPTRLFVYQLSTGRTFNYY